MAISASLAVDDDHTALRSSMISCGERGSKSGNAAISDPDGKHALDAHATARPERFGGNARGARFLFERASCCILDGKALRGGKAFRERLGFMGEVDHEGKFSTNQRRTARNNEAGYSIRNKELFDRLISSQSSAPSMSSAIAAAVFVDFQKGR
jgi:hypothetical protein